jgi:hypothetical protein
MTARATGDEGNGTAGSLVGGFGRLSVIVGLYLGQRAQ